MGRREDGIYRLMVQGMSRKEATRYYDEVQAPKDREQARRNAARIKRYYSINMNAAVTVPED